MTTPDEPGDHKDETIDETVDMDAKRRDGHDFPPKIGQYAIKRVIASGGMGTVYEALQENPRRPAAVKVVKRSMASSEGLRRFEREAQALARLRHPGIAQIYEAGTFEDGGVTLPFFAMEYIPNARTLIEFARTKNYDYTGYRRRDRVDHRQGPEQGSRAPLPVSVRAGSGHPAPPEGRGDLGQDHECVLSGQGVRPQE